MTAVETRDGADELSELELRRAVRHLQLRCRNLETALESNRVIGMAVGIVMATLMVREEEGFGLLARVSQQHNRKLRDVAEDIVLTGDVPLPG